MQADYKKKLIEKLKIKYPPKDRWEMRDAMFEDLAGRPLWDRDKTLIQSALIENGYDDIAAKMSSCSAAKRCRSPYCDYCQRDLFDGQKERFKKFLLKPFKSDEAKARKNLFFVTVLHELIPFDQPDSDILRFPMEKIKSALASARAKLKAVRRSYKDQIKFVGAFELEAVNGLLVNLHPVKGQVLAEMNGTKIKLSDKFILVHSHFIVDLSKIKPSPNLEKEPVDLFREKLREIWTSTRQVDVSRLYENKPVSQSLSRLADYPLKFPIKYYYRFNGIAADNEIIVKGKKQNLARNHEPAVMAEMITGVYEIGLNALFIRMGLTKASK